MVGVGRRVWERLEKEKRVGRIEKERYSKEVAREKERKKYVGIWRK